MLRQSLHEFEIGTRGRGFYDFTDEVGKWLRTNRFKTGLVTLHVLHTSASLLIQENADPDVRADLERFFSKLVEDGSPMFEHTTEGPDDMPAHVRSALTCVNLGIPVRDGQLWMGTWQGIYLWEHRTHPHSRRIAAHFVGE